MVYMENVDIASANWWSRYNLVQSVGVCMYVSLDEAPWPLLGSHAGNEYSSLVRIARPPSAPRMPRVDRRRPPVITN